MKFGETIRELRRNRNLSQRDLAAMVDVTFTYISKIENHKLDFGEVPSAEMICKLATALETDQESLLILADKVPPRIRQRVMDRPEVFARLAELDDASLDQIVEQLDKPNPRKKPR